MATVSVGAPRRFLLRRAFGGESLALWPDDTAGVASPRGDDAASRADR